MGLVGLKIAVPRQDSTATGTRLSRWMAPLPGRIRPFLRISPLSWNQDAPRGVPRSDPQIPLENTFLPRATPADEALAAEAAEGITSAFALLVERHASTVLAVVERAIGDHHQACDLTQEIWIKVHRALPRFESNRRFRPWLFTIALNHVRDEQRKLGRRGDRFRLEDFPVEFPAKVEDSIERRDVRLQIENALDQVPDPYRSAVHLVDVLGLDYDEAARSLECSKGTVKSRVHRGRQAFQAAYVQLTGETEQPKSSKRGEAKS